MPKRDRGDELGRSLVQLLRHGAHEANVPIDDEGWVALDAALAHVNRRGKSFTVADVEQSPVLPPPTGTWTTMGQLSRRPGSQRGTRELRFQKLKWASSGATNIS